MPSALRGRASNSWAIFAIGSPWCSTCATAAVIGISTPTVPASSSTDVDDFTPSAVPPVALMASSSVRPCPMCTPRVWFRDNGETQVATRSPMPARPENVSASAPSAIPSRVISTRPRVITVATVLWPYPLPWAIPTATAMTFFTAPDSSTPTTSVLV